MPDRFTTMSTDITAWWPKLPQHVRDTISADPDASLNAETVTAIGQAGGTVAGAHFVGHGDPAFHLTNEETDWISKRASK